MKTQLGRHPVQLSPEGPGIAQAGFCCCCPLMVPLMPFFALRWVVLRALRK